MSSLVSILRDIKLAHTVFAMPFAVLGAVLGWSVTDPSMQTAGRGAVLFTLVVVCAVAARTWAMVVNRVADRHIDAENPRTSKRVFASGEAGLAAGWFLLAMSAAVFIAACVLFGVLHGNWWPLMLCVPVLVWIGLYSYTKRWTWLCHVYLGTALAISPLAAALAAEPQSLVESPGVWWVALMVVCWVAGFDVIYSLQDMEFDRGRGLNSVPARFGWRGAAWLSRGLHAVALAALVAAVAVEPRFGVLTGVGVAFVAIVLLAEHLVLARRGRAGIPMAFFTLNGVVSVSLCVAAIIDVLAVSTAVQA